MRIKNQTSKIKNRAGVIDVIAQDSKTGEVVLVMNEPEPWDDSDERLLALQERFNAYVSFLLDGELAETNPAARGQAGPDRAALRPHPRHARARVARHDTRSARVPGNKNGSRRGRNPRIAAVCDHHSHPERFRS